ncbi:hypothetical protein U1Q18_017278, partial [Sarracenia purpurea var. burkii]
MLLGPPTRSLPIHLRGDVAKQSLQKMATCLSPNHMCKFCGSTSIVGRSGTLGALGFHGRQSVSALRPTQRLRWLGPCHRRREPKVEKRMVALGPRLWRLIDGLEGRGSVDVPLTVKNSQNQRLRFRKSLYLWIWV